jgi:nucleotide-binding universal stress UspA family protein
VTRGVRLLQVSPVPEQRMGTAGRMVDMIGRQGWLKRAAGGGLGERILRVAPVPVLLVHGA